MRISTLLASFVVPSCRLDAAAASTSGCGPECVGQCFGGTCLFTGSLDDALDTPPLGSMNAETVSAQASNVGIVIGAAKPQARKPLAELLQQLPHVQPSFDSWQAQPLQQQTFGQQVGQQLLQEMGQQQSLQSRKMGLQQPFPFDQQAEPSSAIEQTDLSQTAPRTHVLPTSPDLFVGENMDATSFKFDDGSNTVTSQLSHEASSQGPAQSAFLGSDSGYLVNQVQTLQAELQRAQLEESKLSADNTGLKNQVNRWRVVGSRVADREAKAVQLLEQAAPGATSPPNAIATPADSSTVNAAAAPAAVVANNQTLIPVQGQSLLSTARGYVSGFAPSMPSASTNRLMYVPAVFTVCLLMFMLWNGSRQMSKGCVPWNAVSTFSGSVRCMVPMMRYVGVAHYKVEISEIHVGSLLGGGDVQVSLQIGDGLAMCTEVMRRCDGKFLRFNEVFMLDVRKSDSPLIVTVIDARGKLATLEMAARDLIHLAHREHAEYHRAEMSVEDALRKELDTQQSQKRPYAAMRVRNVTLREPETMLLTSASVPRKVGQPAYGSFS